jgi:hypothetical protein
MIRVASGLAVAVGCTSPDQQRAERGADSGADADLKNLLVEASAWTLVATEDDPFVEWQTPEASCNPIAGFYVENGLLEVDTGFCNFLTVRQALRVDLSAGTWLRMQVVHFDLTAREPSRAHVALQVGEERLWETQLPIPSPANLIDVEFALAEAAEREAPIFFHIDNHGQNTWRLLGLWQK